MSADCIHIRRTTYAADRYIIHVCFFSVIYTYTHVYTYMHEIKHIHAIIYIIFLYIYIYIYIHHDTTHTQTHIYLYSHHIIYHIYPHIYIYIHTISYITFTHSKRRLVPTGTLRPQAMSCGATWCATPSNIWVSRRPLPGTTDVA